MSITSIKKATKVQTFNITHTECYENKFCQFIENVYFCNRKPTAWLTERKRIFSIPSDRETWTLSQKCKKSE